MINFEVKIKGLGELRTALRKYTQISAPILARAINATLAEIHQESTDKNFQFRTPRARRTGFLETSFARGIRMATKDRLWGSIGPTANYAVYAHEGHSQKPGRFVPILGKRLVRNWVEGNPFMLRILRAAQGRVGKHFTDALDKINLEISKATK